jgi:hypothetical protein
MSNKDNCSHTEEEKGMSAILEKKRSGVLSKLKEVSAKAPILKGKDNMIELDPKNKQHKEWYDIDKFEED